MQAGRLRHRVTLQKKSVTRDAMGGESVTWVDQATNEPAAIEPLSARDRFLAQQAQPELTVRIRLRYRAEVSAEWRVKYGTRIFAIVAPPINVGERNRELHLLCSEGVAVDG